MKTLIDYVVVTRTSIEQLKAEIMRLSEEGYVLQGGVSHTARSVIVYRKDYMAQETYDYISKSFSQAMAKFDDKQPEWR